MMKGLTGISLLVWTLLVPSEVRAESSGLEVGTPAPNFFVNTYNPEDAGVKRVFLDKLVGKQASDRKKVLVLSFFNIDCKPCRKELPFLQRLYDEYKKAGLAVVAVNCDYKPEKIEQVKAFLSESRFTFPVLKDRFRALQRRYAVGSFPTLYILDGDGKVARVRVGYNEDTKPFPLADVQRRLGVQPKNLAPTGPERAVGRAH